ncbi:MULTISPECIES: DNA cytosine methyltransferase [Sphingomonas]|uniref:DNA (cytosine-5-)-methyltransferase n=1 Tax=Sphingomonas trueperi TaxID=53317 RepID=A0A7X5Y2F1_9SPHN|nr:MULTISPECIES: DNA cytosine methyltransferase [Sphingomonas]NJB99403.1 DNA (cytosine-5)-methyltransferase 1 [Sphingomonas trueperi]
MTPRTGFIAASLAWSGLFIDGFAGGGGASTGIEQAIGRPVDIAVNHSPTAIAIHKANHPQTEHFCQDIKSLWPLHATRMRPVSGAWFSPDCKEFSRAKGGPVKDRSIRALCWEVVAWMRDVQPSVAFLENVEEFQYAAPLDEEGRPIPGQEGREFKRFVRAIRALGYCVAWKMIPACDFGAPTTRNRLYMIMRRDGMPIVWPKPTHGSPGSAGVRSGRLLPYRTAAECIDWSIRCPSIFDRQKDLADATKRRIAAGVMRYVVNAAEPFIVPVTHTQSSPRTNAVSKPLPTITTANGGEFSLVDVQLAPHVTKFRTGSVGAAANDPLPTITANGEPARPAGAVPLGVVSAFLSSFYTSNTNGGRADPQKPLKTATAGGNHHSVIAAHLEQANTGAIGRDARKPLSTILGKGANQRVVETVMVEADALPPEQLERATRVAAFLVKYYGTDGESEAAQIQPVDRPLDTITTKARFAVVTVTIDARTYVIVDIGLRMLKPRELARAQGFPETYVLDPECLYRTKGGKMKFGRLPIAQQISAIGNSVCPPVARALVAANPPAAPEMRLAA